MTEIKKLSELKPNEKNPRKIDKVALEKLKKSIEEFPEMLELRPIVVNADGVVLGGNMRLRAMKELGITECPVEVAHGLTPEQEREFVIKDNISGGEWEWDIINTDWSDLPLEDWGLYKEFFEPEFDENKAGASPWARVGEALEGELLTFGVIVHRFSSEEYQEFFRFWEVMGKEAAAQEIIALCKSR